MKSKGAREWNPESSPSFWINHASRLLMKEFENRLRPLGFGMAYLPVAMALEQGSALQQKELAERAHVEQPTMAALLARMDRDGLIARTAHPEDRRSAQISLTAKARAALPGAREALVEVADRLTTGFTAEERNLFLSLLKRAVGNIQSLERT